MHWWPRYTFSIFAFFVATVIAFLSFVPLAIPIEVPSGLSVDKIFHASAYFTLALSTSMAAVHDFDAPFAVPRTAVFTFLYGGIIEVIQGVFLVYRTFEGMDLFANATGVLLFFVLGKTPLKIIFDKGNFLN